MRPSSLHSSFFSSLKQVEKRIKLENPSQLSTVSSPAPAAQPSGEGNYTGTESLGSPMYLNLDQHFCSNNSNTSSLRDSEPPREFLSNSFDFPHSREDTPSTEVAQDPQTVDRLEVNGIDEINSLIQLLGLSDCEQDQQKNLDLVPSYDGGFYSKIVGVKGPKCRKEVKRLEGWIKHFLNNDGEERREPLRLAHLLLCKAALLSEHDDDGGRFQFPSTIEEFLLNDPPKD
ncbi:hypothetical protein NMG60_11019078 [Bertholletia excelsa]